jgi:hypothetical protein
MTLLTEPTRIVLHMPQFPTSPAPTNGQTWTDPVTSVSWTFQSSTNTWRLT